MKKYTYYFGGIQEDGTEFQTRFTTPKLPFQNIHIFIGFFKNKTLGEDRWVKYRRKKILIFPKGTPFKTVEEEIINYFKMLERKEKLHSL